MAPTKKEMNAEKAKEVGNVTRKEADTSGNPAMAAEQKANTAASKKVAKPTTAQKKADAISATSKGGENSSGGPETAAQAKKDTAASKAVPKQTTAEKQADVKSTATPKAATP
jgi:hypothetical protein